MAEPCVNLTAYEAKAWAAGATALIRRAKMDICTYREHDEPKTYYDPAMPSWDEGDVLIGREAWAIVPAAYARGVGVQQTQIHGDDGDAAIYRAGFDRSPGGIVWRSAATMPKSLARHRRRVVSVRVCLIEEVTEDELCSAGIGPSIVAGLPIGRWVSVTMTEATDV